MSFRLEIQNDMQTIDFNKQEKYILRMTRNIQYYYKHKNEKEKIILGYNFAITFTNVLKNMNNSFGTFFCIVNL